MSRVVDGEWAKDNKFSQSVLLERIPKTIINTVWKWICEFNLLLSCRLLLTYFKVLSQNDFNLVIIFIYNPSRFPEIDFPVGRCVTTETQFNTEQLSCILYPSDHE